MCSFVPVPVNPPTVFLLALRDFTLPRSNTSSHHAGICICLGDRISKEGNSQNQGSTSSGADVLRLTLKQETFWIPQHRDVHGIKALQLWPVYGCCKNWRFCLIKDQICKSRLYFQKRPYRRSDCWSAKVLLPNVETQEMPPRNSYCLDDTRHPGGLWHRTANCLRQTCLK